MKIRLPFLLALLALPSEAAEHRVRMLNYGQDGSMVFEPAYVRAQPGDTLVFVPEHSGHFVQSVAVPEGAGPWKSRMDEEYSVTLETEGVYVYACPPHLMMSMIGVVQVGRPVNLDAIERGKERLRRKLVMKGERLDDYLSRIQHN